MNLSDFPFWIHGVKCDVSPAFAATPASVLLGRFSTKFRNVFMGIFRPFFEMCMCEDRHWCWPGSQFLLHQVEIRTLQLVSSITSSLMSLWTILYWNCSNWSHKAGSMKLSKTFWCGEALRVAFNGKRSWTSNLHTSIPHLTNLTIGKCSQANIALLHRTARRKSVIQRSTDALHSVI